MKTRESQIDELVRIVRRSRKYHAICDEVISNIGRQELGKRRGLKDAVKATKNKLHQVAGMYFETEIDYPRALSELEEAASQCEEALLAASQSVMSLHTSTRERSEILDEFYPTILANIPHPHRVVDIACGLNPLAIPWMGLGDEVEYYAYDIYTDMVEFIRKYLALVGVRGYAEARDIIQSPPTIRADLTFMLKAIPCIEQIDKNAGERLLEALNTKHLVVSFPAHSIGGYAKGMIENYETKFYELLRGKSWQFRRFEFASELAFLVTKS